MATPKWIRCYDNGGKTADRYTVVYTRIGHIARGKSFYRGMSERPTHPQGVGMWGENDGPIDRPAYSHLGKRIRFEDLPLECRKLVVSDYRDLHPREKADTGQDTPIAAPTPAIKPSAPSSWMAEVQTDSTGHWAGNALRFATKGEGEIYAVDLSCRWTLVRAWRVIESTDAVNYAIVDGKLVEVPK